MTVIERPCPWCARTVGYYEGTVSNCPLCSHRVDVPAEQCDCLVCRARKASESMMSASAGAAFTRQQGFDFRVGRLVTQVNNLGVNRVLVDREQPDRVIEIFESRQRAIEVFLEVWQTMTADERIKFWQDTTSAEE